MTGVKNPVITKLVNRWRGGGRRELTEEEDESSCDVGFSPPRGGQGRANVRNLDADEHFPNMRIVAVNDTPAPSQT